MRLSSQLIGSIVGITILAQIVFGSVAFVIISDDHELTHNILNNHIVKTIAANWNTGTKKPLSQTYLEQMLKQFATPHSTLFMENKEGETHISGNGEMPPADISNRLKNNDNTSGTVEINNQHYHWSATYLPDEKGRLFLLNQTTDTTNNTNYKFATRLITTSIIVLWLAVWIALILSAIINKRIKEKNDALNYQSLHDELTGLPNRLMLLEQLKDELEINKLKTLSLLVMDLDNFKEINDTLGHCFGDILLNEVGRKIQDSIHEKDTLARLGGDEFAVILPETDYGNAHVYIDRLTNILMSPINIEDTDIFCKMSIGISLYPKDGKNADELLKHADIAMYHSKSVGYGHSFYETRNDFNSIRLLKQKNELRQAIDNNQIEVYYQPLIDQKNNRIVCAEALARWNHHELGFISPEEFIHTAERTGSIHKLTMLIIRKALTDCKQWLTLGHQITIAVNISTYCLQDQSFPEKLISMVRDIGMETNDIELEITESTLMEDLGNAQNMLHQLHQAGFNLAIDDFGTGYSSLAYLKEFPVSTIKIDRSFVSNMCTDESNDAIVQTVIGLAHNLQCRVIAEGVEDKQTLEHLLDLGNDIAQGYYFSKPIPNEEFIDWLNETTWSSYNQKTTIQQAKVDNASTEEIRNSPNL